MTEDDLAWARAEEAAATYACGSGPPGPARFESWRDGVVAARGALAFAERQRQRSTAWCIFLRPLRDR